MGAALDLCILGPFEVRVDEGEPLALGGVRQRAVLAVLVLHANEVVSMDRLVDELWGEHPPATAVHSVQVFVSKLRGGLGSAGDRLVTRPPGYVLEVGSDEIDAGRCERLASRARIALGDGDAAPAAELLNEAAALWRGPPLAEFTYEPFAQATIARLEELRLSCREDLIEAQLALGRHADVVSDLEALVREQPFRERPCGQLMRALYRCGRQADALDAYRRVRATLVDELGVEPSKVLRDLEEQILRHDDALDTRHAAATVVGRRQPEWGSPPEDEHSDLAVLPAPPTAADALVGDAGSTVVMLRRTVTVLAVQLSVPGYADPERTLAIIAGARTKVEEVVARHGGAFVSGLAPEVVGIFGLPKTNEDDAPRALRAAQELRATLAGAIVEGSGGPTLRLGLDTGEVIAERPENTFGPPLEHAVSLAGRAPEAEILLTDATLRSAGPDVVTERTPDGTAWRLVDVLTRRPVVDVPAKTPLFGRTDELAAARATFARAARDCRPHLVTVLGDPGIGKSRFAQELVSQLAAEAVILAGRCLAYGDGVTFWPFREAITAKAGGETKDAIAKLFDGAADAELLAGIIAAFLGLTEDEATPEQIRWAMRRLLETLTSRGPVLLVIEDAHRAEPPLLDLIDYLIDWLTAPAMVLCLARPEILDERPRWRGGHERICSIVLPPLEDEHARQLLDHHCGHRSIGPDVCAHILSTAEGNPLFVEQLLAIRIEDPTWDLPGQVPATLQALLAARLDRLGPGERAFVDRAAVIGRDFWPRVVVDLLPAEARPSANEHMRNLVRRGLIHPAPSILAGEEQLLFHHILIRDVAYHGIPKKLRSHLHERVADWLANLGDTYDEFVGYHLERAFRCRVEVGPTDAAALALAARAGARLAAAGRRAGARGEWASAVPLLRGAADMFTASGHRRADVLLDLGVALREKGELRQARLVFEDVHTHAAGARVESVAARAHIELAALRALIDTRTKVEDTEAAAQHAIRVFRRLGDQAGIARALMQLAEAHWNRCCFANMETVLAQALIHARRADNQEQGPLLRGLARAAVMGPRPVEDAIQRCASVLEQAQGDVPSTAYAETMLAVLEAMRGDMDEARRLISRSQRRLEEIGLEVVASRQLMYKAFIELLSEEPEDITPELTRACDVLLSIGERSRLSTLAALHARLLYVHGRYEECEQYARMSADAAAQDDVASQILWRCASAKVLARSGAEQLAREQIDAAVALAQPTDFLLLHGDALRDRAEVLRLTGQHTRAADDLELAIALYEQKGIRVAATAARRALGDLAKTDCDAVLKPSGA